MSDYIECKKCKTLIKKDVIMNYVVREENDKYNCCAICPICKGKEFETE